MKRVGLAKAAFIAAAGVIFFTLAALPKNAIDQTPPSASTAKAGPSGDALALFNAANRERAAARTPVLDWDAALAQAAEGHAELLAEGGAFEHQLPGEPNLAERAAAAGAHFSYISENIAAGPDPETMHVSWMHSPGHRSNLLSTKVNVVGIAVVARGKRLYAVEDFARIGADLSLAEQEKKVRALIAAEGWKISDSYVKEARSVCAGAPLPRLNMDLSMMHFEASELDELPPSVQRDLRSRRVGTASVGACSRRDAKGFSLYRLSLLLY